jgi:cytosine/adenosine deaminase-related metal-dependent hydrolase
MTGNGENTTKKEVDMVLLGGTAITVDSERRVIRDAGIAVKGEDIAFVGKATDVSVRFHAKQTLDCSNTVIIPGIINAHIHYSHHLSKGLIPDNLGGAVQSNFVHTKASPNLTAENEIWGAKALLLEMLKGGTTTFMEAGSYHPFEILRGGIQDIGIKGMMGRRASDRESLGHGSMMEPTDDILKIQEKLLIEFGKEKLPIRPMVTIVGLQRFTDKLVVESKKLADRYGVPFEMHLATWIDSVNECRKRTGYRPVQHLEKLGVLDENVILVHMLYVNQKEVDIVAKHGTKVVWCPPATIKMAHPFSLGRYPEMLDAGIPVAIGSDASDVSNYHDMVRVMYLAATIFKGARFDPELMGAEQAIEMATINGAKAMGMENEIGSLETGKKADIAIFDTNRLAWRPLFNEIQSLIYSANADHVESVIINGKMVMDKRKVLTVDEGEILAGSRRMEDDLKARLDASEMIISPWKII